MRSQFCYFSLVVFVFFNLCVTFSFALTIKRVVEPLPVALVESSLEDGKDGQVITETTTNVVVVDEGLVLFDEEQSNPENSQGGDDQNHVYETSTTNSPSQLQLLTREDDNNEKIVVVVDEVAAAVNNVVDDEKLKQENNEQEEEEVVYNFKYPTTPDPSTADEEFTTVQPVPDGFHIDELEHVNVTEHVIGNEPSNIHRFFTGRASCACGVPSTRIVGGVPERINKLPWTAALVRGGINTIGRPYCGATLINSRYVITASHCVDGMSASGISVRLNQENVYASPNAQSFGVSRIIMHPNYNRGTIDNDIALVQLSQPVQLTRNSPVVPACLPASQNINIDNYQAIAAGWGATSQGGSTSATLQKVEVPIMSNDRCNKESKYGGRITANMLCAGIMEQGGKDSCQGDSGGPLIIQNGARATLVGIVSWGYGCAQPKAPGVYARVSRYPDWILANTREADWCDG